MRCGLVCLAILSSASGYRLPPIDRRAAAKTILAGVAATVSLPVLAEEASSVFVGRYTDPINHPVSK